MTRPLRKTRRLAALAHAIHLARRESRAFADRSARAFWQQRQAQRMLAALEVRVSVTGTFPPAGLWVCNHLSYLDVLVLAAQGPAVFVAKADVRKWPVIGNLLESAGTILAQRGRPMSANTTTDQIREVLEAGLPVILFPEGTSTDGSSVLPFKPTLLQTALDAGAAMTPAAISYQTNDGNAATDICYHGDAVFLPHLIKLAGLEGINASLVIGTARGLPGDRKLAACQLHADVSDLLAQTAEAANPNDGFDRHRRPGDAQRVEKLRVVVLMGVAGCGKSTIGALLAARHGGSFHDADDFHPATNIAKMASGTPLDDLDRAPWLERLRLEVIDATPAGELSVLACSALKKKYREQLGVGASGVALVYLKGDSAVHTRRLTTRPGHYMQVVMLESQLAILEEPSPAEGVSVGIDSPASEIVAAIESALGLSEYR